MRAEYLIFNLVIFFSSTLGVLLYPKAHWPHLKTTLQAILPLALFFIAWDMLVTDWWWYFNPQFTLGFFIGTLPFEEALFFFTVPWSILVLWENLRRYRGPSTGSWSVFLIASSLVLGGASLITQWWYTASVSIGILLVALWAHFQTPKLLADRLFQKFLGGIILLTTIFNGYLTARPIVEYNPAVKSGLHIFTIPVEDYLYGIILLTAIIWIYESRREKK